MKNLGTLWNESSFQENFRRVLLSKERNDVQLQNFKWPIKIKQKLRLTAVFFGLPTNKIDHHDILPTTRISSTLIFRRFYVTHTFLHYDVTSSLHKSWENQIILEKQAVNMFILVFLWTFDFFQLLTFCDLKMWIQKLLNRVEKYRWIFLWTTWHKGKWFFFNIFH
jgi:hypothetical protein